jgi:oligopeptide/dipeptide ABC transporter ATP-binding protein
MLCVIPLFPVMAVLAGGTKESPQAAAAKDGRPKSGGTLTVAIEAGPPLMDPHLRRLMDAVPRGRRLGAAEAPAEVDTRVNDEGCIYSHRCENARDRCLHERPALQEMDVGHRAACHFPAERGTDTRPGVARMRPA